MFKIIKADFTQDEHRKAFVRLIDEYARGDTGNGKPLSDAIKKNLVPGIRQHKTARVYFAVYDTKIVGLATCFTGYSTFSAAGLINIHDLIITKEYRRRGMAAAILEYIADEAKAKRYCKVTLEVRGDNTAAIDLYAQQGFSPGPHTMYFLTKNLKGC
jgi:ribosomal protein S18 acetylase RimI-like enzyme